MGAAGLVGAQVQPGWGAISWLPCGLWGHRHDPTARQPCTHRVHDVAALLAAAAITPSSAGAHNPAPPPARQPCTHLVHDVAALRGALGQRRQQDGQQRVVVLLLRREAGGCAGGWVLAGR